MLFVIAASAFAVIFLNSLAYGFSPETVADSLIYTFFIASSVTLGILYLAPRIYDFAPLKRISIITAEIFITTMIGIFFTRLFLGALGIEKNFIPAARTTIFSLVISYTFGFSAYFYLHSQSTLRRTKKLLRKKELDEAMARSLAAEAQLASLESRIHPHFLFNTLNSIAALIKENPDKAEKMVEKLSALLRYSLDGQGTGLVSFANEWEITRKYLEIEQARFGDRLVYKFETNGNFEHIKIPSLALQTLAENAIKHVASKSSQKTEIRISAFQDNGHFVIEVADNGTGFSANAIREGHGLDNLKKRLNTIFQGKAHLEIGENGAGTARLKIPISKY